MFKALNDAISNCMWAVIKPQGFSCICSFYHNPWPTLLKALMWFPLLICRCITYKFQVHLKGDMFQKRNQSPGIKMTWGLVEHSHHRLLRHSQRRNFKMLEGLDSNPNTFLFQLYAMSKSKVFWALVYERSEEHDEILNGIKMKRRWHRKKCLLLITCFDPAIQYICVA